MEDLIKAYNLKDNVFLLGFQKNPYKYIKFANAFVLSSRWEGLPNVVLESLYVGTPVVATRVVEILDDLIVDGENGYLADVNAGSIVEKLLLVDTLTGVQSNRLLGGNVNVLLSSL